MEEKEFKIKSLTQKTRTYRGIIQKQNKVINAMASAICRLDAMNDYNTWDGNIQEVREHFEKNC